MLELLIGLFTFYTLLKIYISVMQIGFIAQKKQQDAILLTPTKYIIAANYAIKKERMEIAQSFVEYLLFLFWVYKGFAWLQGLIGIDDTLINSLLFLFGFFAIEFFIHLPFEIYKTFVLDKSFHFSNMTPKLFILDLIKQIALFLLFGGAVFSLLIYVIANYENWWLWGFLIAFFFVIALNFLYPTLIAPIFNKFKAIEDKALQEKIEAILKEARLQSNGIFTIDASKRDNRLNAYFAGFGKAKRVVLFDTLLQKLNNDEIIAVLGHELGHYSHKDIFKNIALMGVFFFAIFYIVGHLPSSLFYELGVVENAGVKLALIIMIMPLFSFFFMPIINYFSRKNEYAADEFGAKIGGRENLIRALLKLVTQNKAFPYSHPLYIFFYYSHPPIIKRLEALGYKKEEFPKDSVILGFLDDA